MQHRPMIAVVFALLLAVPARAQEKQPTPAEVVAGVVDAADQLLATLDETQREKLLFDFDDQAQRKRWSNLPVGMVPRAGLRMGDLTDQQRAAVYALIEATLSERGYQQVVDNVGGDEYLRQNGRPGQPAFGEDEFYVSILGRPSATTPWMWQFGGHHLAVNATVVGERITLSPTLTGGQPVSYEINGRKVRLLGGEADQAQALITALTPEQLEVAVVSDRPANLAFGPDARSIEPKPEGIRADQLTEAQQAMLLRLIEERVGILNPTHTKQAMTRIKEGLDTTYFAWFGPTEEGQAAMFRIQGPTVVIEYCPQRMGGDAVQHLHAMYRDPTNDYGAGFVAEASE